MYKIKLSIYQARGRRHEYNFISRRNSKYSGVAAEYNLYKIIRYIDMCIKFELLKIKVSIIFLGMVGFSLRREGR